VSQDAGTNLLDLKGGLPGLRRATAHRRNGGQSIALLVVLKRSDRPCWFGRRQDVRIAHTGTSMLAERRYIERDDADMRGFDRLLTFGSLPPCS